MGSAVYYSEKLDARYIDVLTGILEAEFDSADKIAIKLHFGEPGNKMALTPDMVEPLIEMLPKDKQYFLYDSSVAYGGSRGDPESHKEWAVKKGWDRFGEIVTDDESVLLKGTNMEYGVMKSLIDADAVLVLTHFKGHVCCGFGGAVKNLGMGALDKATKSKIHDGGKPIIGEGCTGCGECEKSCPIEGIKIVDASPKIDLCFGCSNCVVHCPTDVLKFRKDNFDILLSDGAATANRSFRKSFFINIVKNITEKCDCVGNPGKPIAQDVGYVAGIDPVAVDRASRDITVKKNGADVFLEHNKKTGLEHLEAAESFGMGTNSYELK